MSKDGTLSSPSIVSRIINMELYNTIKEQSLQLQFQLFGMSSHTILQAYKQLSETSSCTSSFFHLHWLCMHVIGAHYEALCRTSLTPRYTWVLSQVTVTKSKLGGGISCKTGSFKYTMFKTLLCEYSQTNQIDQGKCQMWTPRCELYRWINCSIFN